MEPTADAWGRLTAAQWSFIGAALGEVEVRADHSWPLQDTVVLELDTGSGRVIVKAGTGEITGHHLAREITALRETVPHAPGFPRLIAADLDLRLVITAWLPGVLVEGTRWESDPRIYRQAGRLAAQVHRARPPRRSDDYAGRMLERARANHAQARELLDPGTWKAAGAALARIEPGPVEEVPTHGDMQPRNWLVDEAPTAVDAAPPSVAAARRPIERTRHPDEHASSARDGGRSPADGAPRVALIDFGRAEWRPWYSDLVRLHHQQFVGRDDLREAFWDGGGWNTGTGSTGSGDVACPVPTSQRSGWLLENLLQSLGTVVWATRIGNLDFAEAGRTMVERTLADSPESAPW